MLRPSSVILTLVFVVIASGGATVAQDATPHADDLVTPDPAECMVEPRSLESLLAIRATNDAGTPLAAPPSTLFATPGIQMPESEPADQETTEAVTGTIRELVACENAGDLRRMFALYTDNVLIEFETRDPLTEEERIAQFGGTPEARPPEAFSSFRVTEVRVLPNGEVVAVTDRRSSFGTGTLVYVLVQKDDRYLVDGVMDAVMEPAGTPPA